MNRQLFTFLQIRQVVNYQLVLAHGFTKYGVFFDAGEKNRKKIWQHIWFCQIKLQDRKGIVSKSFKFLKYLMGSLLWHLSDLVVYSSLAKCLICFQCSLVVSTSGVARMLSEGVHCPQLYEKSKLNLWKSCHQSVFVIPRSRAPRYATNHTWTSSIVSQCFLYWTNHVHPWRRQIKSFAYSFCSFPIWESHSYPFEDLSATCHQSFLDNITKQTSNFLGKCSVMETHVVRTGRKPPVHRRLTEWLTVTVNRRYTAGFLLISAGNSTVQIRKNNFQLSKSCWNSWIRRSSDIVTAPEPPECATPFQFAPFTS